jgi:hypothetical protein
MLSISAGLPIALCSILSAELMLLHYVLPKFPPVAGMEVLLDWSLLIAKRTEVAPRPDS